MDLTWICSCLILLHVFCWSPTFPYRAATRLKCQFLWKDFLIVWGKSEHILSTLWFLPVAKTQFCKQGWFYHNTWHNSQNHTPKLQNTSYILQNEALQPKLCIALSKSKFCTKWHTTKYTLLGIIKSSLIVSMLYHKTNPNSSNCREFFRLFTQKYLQIYTHAVETFFFHQTSQCRDMHIIIEGQGIKVRKGQYVCIAWECSMRAKKKFQALITQYVDWFM